MLTADRPAPGGVSELGARICAVLSERVADPQPDDRIECDDLSVLHTVTAWAGRLVSGSRPLAGTDLALAEVARNVVAGTVDLDELRARVDDCVDAVRAARDDLAGAARTAPALRAALLAVSELVGGEALPVARPGQDDEEAAARRPGRRDRRPARPAGEPARRAGRPTARCRTTTRWSARSSWPPSPSVPVSRCSRCSRWRRRTSSSTSLADRAALVGGDDTAVMAWLDRASLVRPEVDPLCGLLLHAEATGVDVVGDVAVAQLPHRPGARWCELPFGPEGPPPAGTVGLVVVSSGGVRSGAAASRPVRRRLDGGDPGDGAHGRA